MTRRPVIGLPGRRKKASDISGFPGSLDDLDIDMFFADYARAVVEAGGLPVNLPLVVDPADVVELLDGVLLTGGSDVTPGLYGADVHPKTVADPDRDEFEIALLAAAESAGLPVLGVCRGLQVINVARGGTLEQHVPDHERYDVPPSHLSHEVAFAEGTICRSLYGESRSVNSLHHQTIGEVAPGLVTAAVGDDGVVEAVEDGTRLVAVQWHPEMMTSRATDPIFNWLITEASKS